MHGVTSRRLTKAEAFAAFEADPELTSNTSAAARQFNVPRSTTRGWRDEWRKANPPLATTVPPPSATVAAPEPPPTPPSQFDMNTIDTADLASGPPVAVPVDAPRRTAPLAGGRPIAFAVYASAVALATIAAYFSIRGMVVLFPGAPTAVIVMAGAMEAAKLVAVAWLARNWCHTGHVARTVLVVLVTGLAIINGAGVYSQLVAAHLGDRAAATASIETETSMLAARIEVQSHTVTDLDQRLGQIDAAIGEMVKRGRTSGALEAIGTQRRTREVLVAQRRSEAEALAGMKAAKAAATAKVHAIEVETAPIRFVAELVGGSTEQAIRWLILLIVLCCDPLAIALTAAAAAAARSEKMRY
jgi:hypothetical protein